MDQKSSDDKSKEEYYVCSKCGKRVHREWVRTRDLKSGGDVICCGVAMARPMKVPKFLNILLFVVMIGFPLALIYLFNWHVWSSILATAVAISVITLLSVTDMGV